MKQELSLTTTELIEELFRSVPIWRSQVKDRVRLLSSIAESHEGPAIGRIAGFLLGQSKEVRQAAADAIREILSGASPDDYLWLEVHMRQSLQRPYAPSWDTYSPSKLELFESLGASATAALGIASFHWSGYIRHEALRRIALGDGSELPVLLLRLNDWVPEVRAEAARALQERVRPEFATGFIRNLPLVFRLRNSERTADFGLIEAIENLIAERVDGAAMMENLNSPDLRLRRLSSRFALKTGSSQALHAALNHRDPVIRREAVRRLSIVGDSAVAGRLLESVRRDKSAAVRLAALETFANRFPDEKSKCLEQALLDENKATRGWAQSELREELNVRNFYFERLSSADPKIVSAALLGLGEVGTKEYAAYANSYTSHPAPRVRRAAVRLLARLDPESHLDLFLKSLTDSSSRVSREAALALIKDRRFDGASIWSAIASASSLHVKTNALLIISRLRKWESISYLISASADPQLREKAENHIRRWSLNYNKTFGDPTAEQSRRLEDVLHRLPVEPSLRALIRQH